MPDPGYGFVPLPPSVRRQARPEATWDRRVPGTLSGRLEIQVETEQPVHIGSGDKALHAGAVILSAVRVRGGPGLPGTSLKGALRARYEAVTLSCAGSRPREDRNGTVRIRSRSHPGVSQARLVSPARDHLVFRGKCERSSACPACALFGFMSFRGRVTVTDFVCLGGAPFEIASIPERFEPNLHHVGRAQMAASGKELEVSELHGRKFHRGRGPASPVNQDVEVIPRGRRLTGQLRLFNVTPAELGGLLAALGVDPLSALKLGGGKAHELGRVRCGILNHRLSGIGVVPMEPAGWRQAFVNSEDRWAESEERLVNLHDGTC